MNLMSYGKMNRGNENLMTERTHEKKTVRLNTGFELGTC